MGVQLLAGFLQRGDVDLLDIGEMRDGAFGGGHILRDAAAQADDLDLFVGAPCRAPGRPIALTRPIKQERSEEHTSELQSLMRNSYAVFCLKKKKNNTDETQNS